MALPIFVKLSNASVDPWQHKQNENLVWERISQSDVFYARSWMRMNVCGYGIQRWWAVQGIGIGALNTQRNNYQTPTIHKPKPADPRRIPNKRLPLPSDETGFTQVQLLTWGGGFGQNRVNRVPANWSPIMSSRQPHIEQQVSVNGVEHILSITHTQFLFF